MAWIKNDDLGKLLLRLGCGGILLFHGVHKVFVEVDHVRQIVLENGLPPWFAYGNIVGEFFAPALVIAGLATRIGALVIVINMLFSVWLAHPDSVFEVNSFGGWMIETNMLYLTAALALVFTGAGKYSLSGGRGRWD